MTITESACVKSSCTENIFSYSAKLVKNVPNPSINRSFKARPIKHYRKQYSSTSYNGASKYPGKLIATINAPGGENVSSGNICSNNKALIPTIRKGCKMGYDKNTCIVPKKILTSIPSLTNTQLLERKQNPVGEKYINTNASDFRHDFRRDNLSANEKINRKAQSAIICHADQNHLSENQKNMALSYNTSTNPNYLTKSITLGCCPEKVILPEEEPIVYLTYDVSFTEGVVVVFVKEEYPASNMFDDPTNVYILAQSGAISLTFESYSSFPDIKYEYKLFNPTYERLTDPSYNITITIKNDTSESGTAGGVEVDGDPTG